MTGDKERLLCVCLVGEKKRPPTSTLNYHPSIGVQGRQCLDLVKHSCGLDGFRKEVRIQSC